ncbi:MAG: Flp pilus assembly complex ATPase component TadA [Candidatus Omnitrophica bacterium]|nr:Flp pilus assembly complex ATPase component TadA [Candidatus Omnitrophota bacterium]
MDTPALEVKALQEAFAGAGGAAGTAVSGDSSKLAELANQAPIIRLVDIVLAEAVTQRASDIHIETFEHDVLIRYRIDGICYQIAKPPKSLALGISSRIKILSNLDVAETRVPQDGRILMTREARQIDLRVSTLPTIHGESIVLRVLDKGALNKTLNQLGMDDPMREAIERIITRPHGLFLVTGPTGSGKTTTLYASLTTLNHPNVKIITTEDPVEYDINGLVQIAINQKIGLDFSTCLRAILRHDPDIVMVGEIRDAETAQVAIQAALTGHLVFSTLHTNDAPGAVTRLIDMGVEPFLITSTVHAVLAQRLVRRLCPQCRVSYQPTDEDLAALHLTREGLEASLNQVKEAAPAEGSIVHTAMSHQMTLMKAGGCAACQGLGFQGRMGLYELLPMSEEIRPMVLKRASVSEVREAARRAGMRTLREDGLGKALQGETTVEEILRETQDYDAQ